MALQLGDDVPDFTADNTEGSISFHSWLRNFDEVLRVIDSLQLTAKYKVATPSDWKQGQDVIIVPSVNDNDAKTLFPGGWKTVRPYLRLVPQPK